MAAKTKDENRLYTTLRKFFYPSAGQTPILITDTSAVIDLEDNIRELKRGSSTKSAYGIFADLCSLAEYVVFPRGVYEEICEHHLKGRKNGRAEIGEQMYKLVNQHYEKSKSLLEQTSSDYFYIEEYKAEVDKLQNIIESLHRESNCGKKGGKKLDGKDKISDNDIELLNTAIRLAVKSLFTFRMHQSERGDIPSNMDGTYRIAVVSSDCHIYKPLYRLNTHPDGVSYRDYLQAFNTRDYL